VRVKDLAAQLGIKETEIIDICGQLQIPARHITSFLRPEEIVSIKKEYEYRNSGFFKKLTSNFLNRNQISNNNRANI
jgi:hypothetical protein